MSQCNQAKLYSCFTMCGSSTVNRSTTDCGTSSSSAMDRSTSAAVHARHTTVHVTTSHTLADTKRVSPHLLTSLLVGTVEMSKGGPMVGQHMGGCKVCTQELLLVLHARKEVWLEGKEWRLWYVVVKHELHHHVGNVIASEVEASKLKVDRLWCAGGEKASQGCQI